MKRQKFNLIVLGIIIILAISNCTFPKCSTAPETLRFRIISKIDSTDLISSGFYKKDSISIYYLDKNGRQNITLQIQKDSISKKTLVYSDDISWKSFEGIKDFYLYLNYKDIDTIFLDIVSKEDGHCTSNLINSFKYNGHVIQFDDKEYLYKIIK